jgi:hypothetical protein
MRLWWVFYILGIMTGAFLFRKKIRRVCVRFGLWLLWLAEKVLNKGDDDEVK